MRLIVLLPVLFCCTAFVCGQPGLTEEQLRKIDPRLTPVIEGKAPDREGCVTQKLPDGTVTYRVIIRGNAEDLQKEGIHVGGVVGDVMTAMLTPDDIVRAAKVTSVRSIECGSTNTVQ